MIRIEGVPVVAERLQKPLPPECTVTAAASARDASIHIFERDAPLPLGTDRV